MKSKRIFLPFPVLLLVLLSTTGCALFSPLDCWDTKPGSNQKGKQGFQVSCWESGVQKHFLHWKDGKRDGLEEEWFESGQKKRSLHWKAGKKNGLEQEWFENGQKRKAVHWNHDKKNGLEKTWFQHGQKKMECSTHQQGTTCTSWFETGEKQRTSSSLNGILTETIYYRSGSKRSQTLLRFDKDGKLEGYSKEWNEDGTVKSCTNWKKGVRSESCE